MTVRFAARIAIAIVTLLGSAAVCFGQPPGIRPGKAARENPLGSMTRTAAAMVPAEPSAGGTWVADADQDRVLEIPFHGVDADGAPPVDDVSTGAMSGSMPGGEMGGGEGPCQCDECTGQNGGGGAGAHGHG